MHPPIEPFQTGYLLVDHGNEIYWETSGNPDGIPAVFLHGGPGGGLKQGYRRRFDPQRFLIVSFEQRGCGRSRPGVAEGASLEANTTQYLISDIEALRSHLKIEKWLVTGVSWGTTLAAAYAQAHPDRVAGLVLTAVTTTSAQEVEWITESMREIFPQQWENFRDAVRKFSGARLIDRYYEAIRHSDSRVREMAAKAWCEWEDVHPSLDPHFIRNQDFEKAAFRMQFATLVIHYWKHAGFLGKPDWLSDRLKNIPAILIHGRYDVSSPLRTAWDLHKAWPLSELIVIDDEGHGGPKMMEAMALAISNWPT